MPGDHFMNDFSIVIQIQWKIGFSMTPLLGIILVQNVSHATMLSYHEQNYIAITSSQFWWEQNYIFRQIWITMEKSFVKWAPDQSGNSSRHHIDALVQERRNSIAKALELRLSCTNPLICCYTLMGALWHLFGQFICFDNIFYNNVL